MWLPGTLPVRKKEISPHMFQKTLDSLGEEVTLLSNLVGNMLQLSRIDNHEKNLGPVQTDIAMLIPTVLAQFDAVAENKNVRLESVSNTVESVTLQTDAPQQRMVSGSYEQWQQVLRILLDNAIKYTPAGGSVTVGFKVHGKQAHVTVTDTGIGINPHEVDTIFERFYRADTARTIPGSGLGLAIARELVQQLNGKLVVTSTVGKGSTFTVQAPLA
jgi:signal transduction histidine kinase